MKSIVIVTEIILLTPWFIFILCRILLIDRLYLTSLTNFKSRRMRSNLARFSIPREDELIELLI
jgi:hypothetical protein